MAKFKLIQLDTTSHTHQEIEAGSFTTSGTTVTFLDGSGNVVAQVTTYPGLLIRKEK